MSSAKRSSERAESSPNSSRTLSRSASASAPGVVALRIKPSIWSSSPSSCMVFMASPMPIGSSPLNWYLRSHPASGTRFCSRSLKRSACQRRSISSSNCSESCCICALCSGVMEFIIACIAAMRWAMISKSSSSVCGFSGKKSPNSFMNFSNCGSSPCSRLSSMSFNAAIMSFVRCRSSGDIFCISPLI